MLLQVWRDCHNINTNGAEGHVICWDYTTQDATNRLKDRLPGNCDLSTREPDHVFESGPETGPFRKTPVIHLMQREEQS